MHARLVTAQISPEKMDDLIQLWHNQVLSTYQEQTGWKSARLLVDRKTGKAILVSLWETETEGQASGPGSPQGQKVHAIIGHLLTGRPVVEQYEVAGDT
jgi:quinol monooxygenase YgiN